MDRGLKSRLPEHPENLRLAEAKTLRVPRRCQGDTR